MMCLPDLSELTCLEKGLTLQCDGRGRHPHIKHSRENVFLFGEAIDIWRQPEEAGFQLPVGRIVFYCLDLSDDLCFSGEFKYY